MREFQVLAHNSSCERPPKVQPSGGDVVLHPSAPNKRKAGKTYFNVIATHYIWCDFVFYLQNSPVWLPICPKFTGSLSYIQTVMRRWESDYLECGFAVVLTPASTVNITKTAVPISDLYSQDLVLFIDQCMAQWQIESLSALWWTVNGFPPSHPCHPFLSWLLNIIIMGKVSSSCPAIHPLPATRLIFCSMSLSHHPVQRTASPLRNSSQYRIESPL